MSALRSTYWFREFGLAACFTMSLIAGSAPARADFFGFLGLRRIEPPAQLPLDALTQRLSHTGFRALRVRQNGSVHLVDAVDRSGRPVRLVVDVRDGAILQRFASVAPQRAGAADGPPPGFAPAPAAPTDSAPPGARSRSQPPRAKSSPEAASPAVATVAPASAAPEPILQQKTPPPIAAAASPGLGEQPRAVVGPGYANGVPINPLD